MPAFTANRSDHGTVIRFPHLAPPTPASPGLRDNSGIGPNGMTRPFAAKSWHIHNGVNQMKLFTRTLIGTLALTSLVSTGVLAEDVKSYVTGASGITKNSAGECWRTPYMTDAKLEECGYAKPAPAPAPAKVEVVAAPSAASMTTKVAEKITLSAAMLFDFDSAVLSEDATAVIDERIERIRGRAKLTSIMKVVGHTDSSGPEAYNEKLSLARAQAVADYIAENSFRVRSEDMQVIGMGESQPTASNDTVEGRRLNRRVEIYAEGVVDK